jgi:O-antigen/teichoic acid export membrane protein
MSAQDLAVSLVAFGMARSLAKYVASSSKENKEYDSMVSSVLTIIVALSIALTGVALLLLGLVDWLWVWLLINVGPQVIFLIAQSTLRGQFDRNRELTAAVLNVVIQTAGVAVYVFFFPSPKAPVMGFVVANVLIAAGILAYFIYRQRSAWRFSVFHDVYRSAQFKSLLFLSAPLWLTEILAVVSDQADVFIVQGQLGYIVLAEYGAAFTLIGLLSKPTSVLSRIFLVTFAGGFYTDIKKYEQVAAINSAFISTLGLAATVLAIPLTPIIFGVDYTLAPLLTAILSVSFVFKSIEVLNTALTIAIDYPQSNLYSKIWTLIIYIPSAYILVYHFGVIGAACSNVISWGSYALIHAWYMGKKLPDHAAYTVRHSLLGTVLYVSVISIVLLINQIWVIVLAVPLYLGMGHLLQLWDLKQVPGLLMKLKPSRLR